MSERYRVLVADSIALDGLAPLRDDPRFELVVKPNLKDPELADAIAEADAVLVRSATRITRDSLARADRLKVIGRAGVGVDTIDVDAATERGIAVLTAPAGNTISAAELTFALLLALARKVPEAHRSMREGQWDRKSFTGIELYGKTLGLIGAGRIGGEVARRARAFGMRVLAYDPFLNAERARALDVEVATLDQAIERADIISVHVPLTDSTRNLIGRPEIARMKRGVFLLNVARGGVVDEAALLEALHSGQVGGAALDVYSQEPLPADHPLRNAPNVVLTPHLGASTMEAQHHVAVEIAEAVRAALLEGDLSRAVNAPDVGGADMQRLRPVLELARQVGTIAAAMAGAPLAEVEVRYAGSHPAGVRLVAAAAVAGALAHLSGAPVNIVNALKFAASRNIRVAHAAREPAQGYPEFVEVRVVSDTAEGRVAGALRAPDYPRLVRVGDFAVDVPPQGTLLLVRHRATPQVAGALNTLLGSEGITLLEYQQVHRDSGRAEALSLLRLGSPVSSAVLSRISGLPEASGVLQVELT
ncbi:MAG TPA: phosphoglycerate dehydrogenase [Gemmatimonadaceae bacterium]|nr:phosphoglycerate dehydrogenase [Gemmatimonadaceae bacterium]